MTTFRILGALLALATAAAVSLSAAPSGGPYGPIQQHFDLPTTAGSIYFVAPDGDADAPGTTLDAPTTIEAAITRVITGDAIVLRGGTYRTGDLQLNQGITLQPYADELPVLKGTRIVTADQATKQKNGLWRITWPTLFPLKPEPWWTRGTYGATTPPWLFDNDMVFVDGQPLKTVGWEGDVNAQTFSVDYAAGNIYLAVDPAEHVVEITAFDNALTRTILDVHGKTNDHRGPIIRGLTFTAYAYRAIEIEGYDPQGISPEADHGNDVIGTTLEHCTITHCSRVAGYFRGDHMVFRHNLISDTSTEGIFILASDDALLEKNIFRRNNVEGIEGYFPSAVKIFNQTHRVIVRDNLLLENPGSNGIWYDVGNVDGVFINNWLQDSYNGFFFEISKGVTVAGNVFVNSGGWVLNSSSAQIYQNTFVNSTLRLTRTTRSAVGDHFDWHPASGPGVTERLNHVVRNNLFVSDGRVSKPLASVEQDPQLAGQLTDQPASWDYNVYVRTGGVPAKLFTWAPVPTADDAQADFASLADLQAVMPSVEPHGVEFPNYRGPLFRGLQLLRFELMPNFPAAHTAGEIPTAVRALIGGEPGIIGAYPIP